MRRSPAERRHRVLIVVLVLLVVVQPLWSRIVDDLWDALVAPRPVAVVAMPAALTSTSPPTASVPTVPPAAAAGPAPSVDALVEPTRPATDVESVSEPETGPAESEPAVAAPPPLPEVLGASPRGGEIRVLVELRGNDVDAALDEICLQAQAFVETDISSATVRVLGQTADEPAADLGLHRCP